MFLTLALVLFISNSPLAQADDFLFLSSPLQKCRRGVIEKSLNLSDKSIILQQDQAADLVEDPNQMIYSLVEMDKLQLLNKSLTIAPWSDSYWPLYRGTLGLRYNDDRMFFSNWKKGRDYVKANPAKELIRKKKLNILSPSEKYDFLLGLENDNLTKASWAEGEGYFNEYGDVETWMGLCHGWAAAAMMMPDPKRKVDVKTTAGQMTFYPSDIKGLATLLWAKGDFHSRFVGGRCNAKAPGVDNMGRPMEPDCLDNNPGTWHLAIVNQIGVFDRSFVMDATYDYQVWNQPVYGYEYSYFNPKTKDEVSTLAEAKVSVNNWTDDQRKKVRAPQAKNIVGIKMRVVYVTENAPSDEEFQPTQYSAVDYEYDLELDSQDKIIGGEWYSQNHPDFLWVADKNTFPKTYGDRPDLKIDLNNISNEVKSAAGVNARYSLPLGAVVRELFDASAEQE